MPKQKRPRLSGKKHVKPGRRALDTSVATEPDTSTKPSARSKRVRDPYGTTLEAGHALRIALARYPDWKVVSIPHHLQRDLWNCGPWSHVGLEIFVEYFKAGQFDGLAEAFTSKPELKPLNLIPGRGIRAEQALSAASVANLAYVHEVRDEMRRALHAADECGEMPFPSAASMSTPVFFSAEFLQGGQSCDDAMQV